MKRKKLNEVGFVQDTITKPAQQQLMQG